MPELETPYYRPGLIFFSKNTGYIDILTRDNTYHYYPDGTKEILRNQLIADFADHSVTGSGVDADYGMNESLPLVKHLSSGGVFDLDAAAVRMGWTDDEKETAARVMLKRDADPAFNDYWQAPLPALLSPPWPNYAKVHHFKVAALAEELGLVGEALAYEKQNKNRELVVKALEEKAGVVPEELAAA